LLSGSDDAQICLWDICAATKGVNTLEARQIFRDHSGVVEVQFPNPWSETSYTQARYTFGNCGAVQDIQGLVLSSPALHLEMIGRWACVTGCGMAQPQLQYIWLGGR
jgi:hypothetical protein